MHNPNTAAPVHNNLRWLTPRALEGHTAYDAVAATLQQRSVESDVMRRKLFNLATALSLVLCVATVPMWFVGSLPMGSSHGRYYGWGSYFPEQRAYRWIGLDLVEGSIGFRVSRETWPADYATPSGNIGWFYCGSGFPDDADRSVWNRMGFAAYDELRPVGGVQFGDRGFLIPCWALAIATAILPVMRIRNWYLAYHRQYRREHQCCAKCGYDLRATPNQCPECGAMPEPARPPHNPPMQWTEPAGKLLVVRESARRRPGH